jgi:site-specific recombinase XerD
MSTLRKRMLKGGGFFWEIDFYNKGRRFRKSTKTDDHKVAKLIQKEIEAKIAKGLFQVEEMKQKKAVFLKEFIDEFLDYSKSRKAFSTWVRDRIVLKGFYAFTGNRSLDSIDKRLIDQFLQERVGRLKKTTVNIDLRHLKAAFSKAVEWGHVQTNPVKGLKPFEVPQSAPKYLNEMQFKKILMVIQYQHLKEIVLFAANTGVRVSELINIAWADVDFHNMTVRIANKDDFQTKTKRERTIPLNETAYDVLSGLERKGEYVFCRKDGVKRDKHYVCRSFKAAVRKAGLGEGYSFHSLRHTFASLLVQKGISLYIVQKLLGHSNIKTTEIYAYLAPEKRHDVVAVLDLHGAEKLGKEAAIQAIQE